MIVAPGLESFRQHIERLAAVRISPTARLELAPIFPRPFDYSQVWDESPAPTNDDKDSVLPPIVGFQASDFQPVTCPLTPASSLEFGRGPYESPASSLHLSDFGPFSLANEIDSDLTMDESPKSSPVKGHFTPTGVSIVETSEMAQYFPKFKDNDQGSILHIL